MKKQNRHISLEGKLIVGIIISLLVFVALLYLYHTCWNGRFFVNDVPTSIVGIGIIIIIPASLATAFVFAGILLAFRFPIDSKTKQQIEKLSDTFEPVQFKDFEYFTLSDLVSNEDVKAFAKMDKDGKITIKISVTHETNKPELFVKHFKV